MLTKRLTKNFETWPEGLLTAALLAGAIVIIAIALLPGHPIIKAIALAYIVLP